MGTLELQRQEGRRGLEARNDPARRPPASPAAAILALQRSAGNHAVAQMLARSCDEEDEANQRSVHTAWVQGVIGSGEVPEAEESEEGSAMEIEETAPPPQPPMAAGPSPEQELEIVLESEGEEEEFEDTDEFGGEEEFGSEEESVGQPSAPEQIVWEVLRPSSEISEDDVMVMDTSMVEEGGHLEQWFYIPEMGGYVPLSFLKGVLPEQMTSPSRQGFYAKRVVARTKFTSSEPQTKTVPVKKKHKFTPFKHGDNPAKDPVRKVGERTKVKRRGLQPGTATNQSTRPPGWWDFITLIGFRGHNHCSYVMGHLLNKDFGGFGNHMYNLAPFSSRLNARHKTQVENPLRDFIKGAPKKTVRTIDYKVKTRYGNPAAMMTDAADRFDDFLNSDRKAALKAWVGMNLITAQDAKKLTKAKLTAKTALQGGGTWDQLVKTKRAEVKAYVKDHFPESIWCTARQYERTGKSAKWNKTNRMTHEIKHSP